MKKLRLGELEVWAAGGRDGSGAGDTPAIVFCHGFGGAAADLESLVDVVDELRPIRWFFPQSPLQAVSSDRTTARVWWPVAVDELMSARARGEVRRLVEGTPAGFLPARSALEDVLLRLGNQRGLSPGRTIIGGFGQGAMLATEIALFAHLKPFAGVVSIAGGLISHASWVAASILNGPKIHALVAHGRRDPILPFIASEALRALLVASGANVRFVASGEGHELSHGMRGSLALFALQRFAEAGA